MKIIALCLVGLLTACDQSITPQYWEEAVKYCTPHNGVQYARSTGIRFYSAKGYCNDGTYFEFHSLAGKT